MLSAKHAARTSPFAVPLSFERARRAERKKLFDSGDPFSRRSLISPESRDSVALSSGSPALCDDCRKASSLSARPDPIEPPPIHRFSSQTPVERTYLAGSPASCQNRKKMLRANRWKSRRLSLAVSAPTAAYLACYRYHHCRGYGAARSKFWTLPARKARHGPPVPRMNRYQCDLCGGAQPVQQTGQ